MSDSLINLMIALVALTPFSWLSWWIIRKTPVDGLSGVAKWRAYRIRIGAGSLILINIGLLLYFSLGALGLWQ